MPSFTEKQIESLTMKLNEIFGNDERIITAIDAVRSVGLKKKKEKKVREEGRMKRPSPASWLFREDKREFIIQNIKDEMDFEDDEKKLAHKVSGKEIVKKAKELWDEMSKKEQKPWLDKNKSMWEEYYTATGGAKSSSPVKSPFNVEVPDKDAEVIEGWCGPYSGKHLLKFANGRKTGEGKFETLELAIEAANKLETCGGITYKPKDGYTLRVGADPVTHVDDSHISWTKENHTMKLPEKKQRKKSEKKVQFEEEVKVQLEEDKVEEVDKLEEGNKEEIETQNQEFSKQTDDEDSEDDEDLEVTPWEYRGITYLLDKKKLDVYDYDSQDLIGKKNGNKLTIFAGSK